MFVVVVLFSVLKSTFPRFLYKQKELPREGHIAGAVTKTLEIFQVGTLLSLSNGHLRGPSMRDPEIAH